jgi:hypothetical protein
MFKAIETMLLAATMLLFADGVPTFNVEPHCRAVARLAEPIGDANVCVEKEQEARDQLVKQWTQFLPAEKDHCLRLATLGGDPIYTKLLTCLEMQRDARRLRKSQL